MAGRTGTPLPKKLGIKPGHKVSLLNAPQNFARRLDAPDVLISRDLRRKPVDIVVLFVERLVELERRFTDVADRLHPEGGFWVAWKNRRGCDLTEEVVRQIALACGMIDNKTCAIGDWTGVRLVVRGDNRAAVAYRAAPPPLSRRVRQPAVAARVVERPRSAAASGSSLRRARARSTR